MIEAEIRGPVAKKEYEKLKRLLETAGEHLYSGYHIDLAYADKGYNNREVRLEYKNGVARIFVRIGRVGEREEIETKLADGEFSGAVKMFAELGYKKGTVTAQKVFAARYGGALFSLYDPDGESMHYEAVISVQNPTEAKEAKQKLEKLARNFKLPLWSTLDMLEFGKRLHQSLNSMYDYDTDGPEHFKNKFGL